MVPPTGVEPSTAIPASFRAGTTSPYDAGSIRGSHNPPFPWLADIPCPSITHGAHMASFTKLPSGLWRASVFRRGVRKTATFQHKATAQRWAADVEAQILDGKLTATSGKTVRQALERYAAEVSPTKRTGPKEQLRIATFLREPWAAQPLDKLTADDLGRWRDRRLLEVQGESLRRDMTILSAVLSTCVREWGWLQSNPLSRVRKPPPGKPRTRLPGWRYIRRVCRACGYRTGNPPDTYTGQLAYLLLLSLRTAMRKGEMLGLKAGDVDLSRRVAVLEQTKNGDRREVPLSRRAVRILRPLMPGLFTVSSASADALWRKVCARAGVEDFHLHDARAAALTSMSRKVDVLTLARISGHRDIKMLSRYYRATAEQIADRL